MLKVYIGSCPNDEPCVPTGMGYEPYVQRAQAKAYKEALEKHYEPTKAQLKVIRNGHEFGTYYSVEAWAYERDEIASAEAYEMECGLETWAEAGVTFQFSSTDYKEGTCDAT